MKLKSLFWRGLLASAAIGVITLGLFTNQAAWAQSQAGSDQAESTSQRFQAIEQPLPLKVGVTLGGVALIGLELWWFLGHAPRRSDN